MLPIIFFFILLKVPRVRNRKFANSSWNCSLYVVM